MKCRPLLPLLALLALLAACHPRRTARMAVSIEPRIFPDYRQVTVPATIAPLNFEVSGARRAQAVLSCRGKELLCVVSRDSVVRFPLKAWHQALQAAAGGSLEVTVSLWNTTHPDGLRHKPFSIYVSSDSIEPWIAYRLIPPGYELWHRMGIYQRDLTNFTEKPIVTNRQNHDGCVNCHSFWRYSPEQFMFHARGQNGGTVLLREGRLTKLALEQMGPKKSGTYPMWHPLGRYIVLSSNTTRQSFYGHSRDKIEVYDLQSDLIIYDVRQDRVLADPRFNTADAWETFPAFSPDGRYLYYCVAHAVPMPGHYADLKYALCRVPFDEHTGRLGAHVDTLWSPSRGGGSVSFPRLSPNGRFLLFTLAECGTFPIHHKEADLKMLRLDDGRLMSTAALNSSDVDSYHSWASSSRWVIFSSKRLDGRCTRLFLAHVDSNGRFGKPFLLPQKSPMHNRDRIYSYNIPEFVAGPVQLGSDEVASLFE